jgi:hypothetical protein
MAQRQTDDVDAVESSGDVPRSWTDQVPAESLSRTHNAEFHNHGHTRMILCRNSLLLGTASKRRQPDEVRQGAADERLRADLRAQIGPLQEQAGAHKCTSTQAEAAVDDNVSGPCETGYHPQAAIQLKNKSKGSIRRRR